MMKSVLLSAVLLAGTSMLCEADPVKNLYPNPEFQTSVGKNGKILVNKHAHWYVGKILEAGKKDGRNAIKFQSEKVSYGGFNAAMPCVHKLPAGKYNYSVWCLVEPGENTDGIEFRLINRIKVNKKPISELKRYNGTNKPVPGKWFEMTATFEIKEKTGDFFMFGHYGKNQLTAWYANPSIEKSEE